MMLFSVAAVSKNKFIVTVGRVNDCCLTSTLQFVSHIMARTTARG